MFMPRTGLLGTVPGLLVSCNIYIIYITIIIIFLIIIVIIS